MPSSQMEKQTVVASKSGQVSSRGQIKIQEDGLTEARNAKRNFALTPFALSPATTFSRSRASRLRGKALVGAQVSPAIKLKHYLAHEAQACESLASHGPSHSAGVHLVQ